MREKLLDLMKSEGLKSSQLADMLGINPAGISHILAGRNKPGFDLLQKILRRFPRISPDWLLLDSGPMYRDTEESARHLTKNRRPRRQPRSGLPNSADYSLRTGQPIRPPVRKQRQLPKIRSHRKPKFRSPETGQPK